MFPSFFKKLGPIKLDVVKTALDCETINISNNDTFEELVSINKNRDNSLSFLYDNENLVSNYPSNSGIVCTENVAKKLDSKLKLIVVKNVQESVASLSNIFYRDLNNHEISKLSKPVIGEGCEIGNNVNIENGVTIGNKVKLGHGVTIKHSCSIGSGSNIGSNTTVSNSIMGENIYIGNNTSIGQRGFGFYINNNGNINIYHIGSVILKSNVSIGSGCTIDRGSFSDTVIGKNTFIDNLCHIAHNVEVGDNCVFAAMTGIAGSTKVGDNVLTGGQVGIAGHIKVGNNVKIAAKSGVFNSLDDGTSVMGNPAVNKYTFIKNYKKNYGKK